MSVKNKKLALGLLALSIAHFMISCGPGDEDIKDPVHFGPITEPLPENAKLLSNEDFDFQYRSGKLKIVNELYQVESSPGGNFVYAPWDSTAGNQEAVSTAQVEHEFYDRLGNKKTVYLLSPATVAQATNLAKQRFDDTENQTLLYKTFFNAIAPNTPQLLKLRRPEDFKKLNTSARLIALRDLSHVVRTASLRIPNNGKVSAPSLTGVRSCADDIGVGTNLDHIGGGSPALAAACAVPSATGLVKNYNYPMKDHVSCVKDQGGRGTCWAFAATSLMESAIAVKTGSYLNLSEQHLVSSVKLYWWPSMIEDSAGTDILWRAYREHYPFLLENRWEYNIGAYRSYSDKDKRYSQTCRGYSGECSDSVHQAQMYCTDRTEFRDCGFMHPPADSVNDTSQHKVSSFVEYWNYGDADTALELGIAALRMKMPMQVAFSVTGSFDSGGWNGGWSTWTSTSRNEQSRGGHMVHVVGYISNEELHNTLPQATQGAGGGYFILKNSWGPCSGDAGYYYVPREYLKHFAWSFQALNAIE